MKILRGGGRDATATLASSASEDIQNMRTVTTTTTTTAPPLPTPNEDDRRHVVRLLNVRDDLTLPDETSGRPRRTVCLEMELCNGGELFNYLMYTGRFEERLARTYFNMLCRAVRVLHRVGFVHRDIKAENVLLHNGVLKLADFGFSTRSIESDTGRLVRHRTQCGTPGYMAPELLDESSRVAGYAGSAVDVWAVGCVLFIMLFGAPCMNKAKPGDWWFDRLKEKRYNYFWRAHEQTGIVVSAEAKDLIQRLLTIDPSARIGLDEVEAHPWVKGPACTEEEAIGLLQERKRSVERQKAQERGDDGTKMDEDNKDDDDDDGEEFYDPFDDAAPVYRSLGGSRTDDTAPPITRFTLPRDRSEMKDVLSVLRDRNVRSSAGLSDIVIVDESDRFKTICFAKVDDAIAFRFAVEMRDRRTLMLRRLAGDLIRFNRLFTTLETIFLGKDAPKRPLFGKLPSPSSSLLREASNAGRIDA